METKDGCPLAPGSNLNRTFTMKPLAQMCNQERGLVLDAALSKERDETNLASSSLAETGDPNDLLGVIVSYSVKVTLLLSGMGGELVVDVACGSCGSTICWAANCARLQWAGT